MACGSYASTGARFLVWGPRPSCFLRLTVGAGGAPLVWPPHGAAVQRFTEEAGVVIYTIDDDGVVSMFESRPGTDITLSVTRGTREQMQPQITEITPQEVAAGTSTTLKIQGKNLIGATVKFSVPGIDVSPYLTKPT